MTALQYVWCLRFSEFVTQLTELLEKLVVPDTAESKQAQSGLVHLTFEESVYTFCQEYFHLQSFNAADTLTKENAEKWLADGFPTKYFIKMPKAATK